MVRVSVATGGGQPSGASGLPAPSADGSVVAFESEAGDLVPGDVNDMSDVFVHDRHTGVTTRVSVGPAGTEADGPSGFASLSDDGRFVAFHSEATNLVEHDTNELPDIFVHDRITAKTSRLSRAAGGGEPTGPSQWPSISGDSRFVAFSSLASDIVAGDTNRASDIFVHDRQQGTTARVSVGPGGVQADGPSLIFPSISRDGRYVAFTSQATNLVPADTNGKADAFVHDRQTGTTSRVSIGPGGAQSGGPSFVHSAHALSGDGRFVTFASEGAELVARDGNGQSDVFIHDRQTGETILVSRGPAGEPGDAASYAPSITADGRFVAFTSEAGNLASGDAGAGAADVFLFDRDSSTPILLSVGPGGAPADAQSAFAAIGAGRPSVAFESAASLVAGDTNSVTDVFLAIR